MSYLTRGSPNRHPSVKHLTSARGFKMPHQILNEFIVKYASYQKVVDALSSAEIIINNDEKFIDFVMLITGVFQIVENNDLIPSLTTFFITKEEVLENEILLILKDVTGLNYRDLQKLIKTMTEIRNDGTMEK